LAIGTSYTARTSLAAAVRAGDVRETMSRHNQFELLEQRRFLLPFFLTQFLGAFNDNVYKNALVILLAFSRGEPEQPRSAHAFESGASAFHPAFLPLLPANRPAMIADKLEKSMLITPG